MTISLRTTDSGVFKFGTGMDGWNNGRGDTRIKKQSFGLFTHRRDSVEKTNDHIRAAEDKITDMGSGYGSNIRSEYQNRGTDYMRKIDYSGQSGNSTSVGLPSGKALTVSELVDRDDMTIAQVHSDTDPLKPAINTGSGTTNPFRTIGSDINLFRPAIIGEINALKESMLYSSVAATAVYIPKYNAYDGSTDLNSNIREDFVRTEATSGTNLLSKFARATSHYTSAISDPKIRVATDGIKTYAIQYSNDRSYRDLVSKITAGTVVASSHTDLNGSVIAPPAHIKTADTVKAFRTNITPPAVEVDASRYGDGFKLRKQTVDMTGYSGESNPTIPR